MPGQAVYVRSAARVEGLAGPGRRHIVRWCGRIGLGPFTAGLQPFVDRGADGLITNSHTTGDKARTQLGWNPNKIGLLDEFRVSIIKDVLPSRN